MEHLECGGQPPSRDARLQPPPPNGAAVGPRHCGYTFDDPCISDLDSSSRASRSDCYGPRPDEMGGGHMYAFRPNGQKVSSQDSATQRCLYTQHALLHRSARRATSRGPPTTFARGSGQSDPQRGGPARHPRLRATATAPAPQSGSSRLLVADSDLRTREAKGGPNSVSSRSS